MKSNHRAYCVWAELTPEHYQLLIRPGYMMMVQNNMILFRECEIDYARLQPRETI